MPGPPSSVASEQQEAARDEEEERLHFQKVRNAFSSYKKHAVAAVHRREEYLGRLPKEHQRLLRKHGYQDTLDDLKEAVEANQAVVAGLLAEVGDMFDNVSHAGKAEADPRVRPSQMDMEKVQSTLKQVVREWSSAGAAERQQSYAPILAALQEAWPDRAARGERKVLVPGAGLGRLAFEIAKEGFECQGNEFSLFMLFTSNFVLNKTSAVDCFKVFPFIHNFCNHVTSADQLQAVTFPDTDPNLLPEDAKFSMAAGNFLEVYSEPEYLGSQDAVVTCFFLDCAHNPLEFVQVIHRVLRSGGLWINLGPLLYHFADQRGEDSIEPSYATLRAVIKELGFTFLAEEQGRTCTYDQDPTSMLQYQYNAVFFTAKKN